MKALLNPVLALPFLHYFQELEDLPHLLSSSLSLPIFYETGLNLLTVFIIIFYSPDTKP